MGAQGMTDQTLAALSDLRQTRQTLAALVDALPEEALTTIPEGFNNHILWNVGHLVVTQQVLVYGLSSLQPNVSAEMMGAFRKGTSPRDWCGARSNVRVAVRGRFRVGVLKRT